MTKEELAKEYVRRNTFHDIDNSMYDAFIAGYKHRDLDTHDVVVVQERLNNVIDVKDKLYYKCESLESENERLRGQLLIKIADKDKLSKQIETLEAENERLGDHNHILKADKQVLTDRIVELREALNGLYEHTPDIEGLTGSNFDNSFAAAIRQAKAALNNDKL